MMAADFRWLFLMMTVDSFLWRAVLIGADFDIYSYKFANKIS